MNDAASLIVCSGVRIRPECARVIADSEYMLPKDNCRFVMSEWVKENQFRQALLLWVVDDSAPWGDVRFALSNRIPLLVPENNGPMKEICVNANCGMWYRDETDARMCLEYLLAEDEVRERMGSNGQSYAGSTKPSAR